MWKTHKGTNTQLEGNLILFLMEDDLNCLNMEDDLNIFLKWKKIMQHKTIENKINGCGNSPGNLVMSS